MARKRVRRIESLICDAVRDLVFPTSVGLGLVVAGCGSSSGDSDGGADAAEASIPAEAGADRAMDTPMYAILPPRTDATVDTRLAEPDTGRDAPLVPPGRDASEDRNDARADTRRNDAPIYAIMPMVPDASVDRRKGEDAPTYGILPPARDAAPDRAGGKPDAPIYAIAPPIKA